MLKARFYTEHYWVIVPQSVVFIIPCISDTDTRPMPRKTSLHLEADFAEGSINAALQLARMYMLSEESTEQNRALQILDSIINHNRGARRLMAYCYLYGVATNRNIAASRHLLRNL